MGGKTVGWVAHDSLILSRIPLVLLVICLSGLPVIKPSKFVAMFLLLMGIVGCGSGVKKFGPVQIQLAIYTPLCLEVRDASTAEGQVVQTYPCIDNEKRQEWTLTPVDDKGNYNIVNINSMQCMSIDNANPVPSSGVLQAPCYSPATPSQIWSYSPAPLPRIGYNLISNLSGLCLDIPQGETVGETPMQVYTCTVGDPAQAFVLNPVSLGTIP